MGKGTGAAADSSSSSSSLWLATNPSKRWGELFFLLYTPFWLTLCLDMAKNHQVRKKYTSNLAKMSLFSRRRVFSVICFDKWRLEAKNGAKRLMSCLLINEHVVH